MPKKAQSAKVATTQASPSPETSKPKKPQAKSKAVKKAEPVKASPETSKADKHKKPKMIRDSFTMPQDEYAHLSVIKERCLKAGVAVKKSEVLRAAVTLLSALSDQKIVQAITSLPTIKTGRPVHPKP